MLIIAVNDKYPPQHIHEAVIDRSHCFEMRKTLQITNISRTNKI